MSILARRISRGCPLLDIIVLGSAAGGGFPQWNCHCANCARAWAGDPAAAPRGQTSLAVRGARGWFLLNAAPDLRQQITATPELHPTAGSRHSPIAGVVLTNAEIDHVAGLLHLRERQPLSLYATPRVHGALRGNPVFNALDAAAVRRHPMVLDEPLALSLPDGRESGLVVRPFAVPGKVALYLEDPAAGDNFGSTSEDTVALEVAARGASFFYVPGCAEITPGLTERLRGARLVFFDGTLWRDDEMIASGVGRKTGGRMGHISMSGRQGSIAGFAGLGVNRKIFIHINNTNPAIVADSPERARLEDAGWEVAFDGMRITLSDP